MKSFRYAIFALAITLSILLSACGTSPTQQPAEFTLAPNDPNNIPGQSVTSIDNRPTLQEQYNKCSNKIDYDNPELEFLMTTNEFGQQAAQMWKCGQYDESNIVWINALALTKVVPGEADDATVIAIIVLKNGAKLVGLLAAAYLTGAAIAYSIDSASDPVEA